MARGSLSLVVLPLFNALLAGQGSSPTGYLTAGWISGLIIFAIAFVALALTEETFGKDLNYIEQ
jgi:putative MFS transporter